MSKTVGDFFWRTAARMGRAARSSATPATASTACSARCSRAGDKIEFIQVRHEEMAAFMASAYAKFTGELGVCLATSGPGRVAPDHRPLRRAARPHAGAGDRRPAGARGARRRTTSRNSTCDACSRTWPAPSSQQATRAGAGAPPDRPRRCASPWPSARVTGADLPERPAGAGLRGAAARKHGTVHSGRRLRRARGRAARGRPAARRRGAERRQEGRDPGRRRRAAARPTR